MSCLKWSHDLDRMTISRVIIVFANLAHANVNKHLNVHAFANIVEKQNFGVFTSLINMYFYSLVKLLDSSDAKSMGKEIGANHWYEQYLEAFVNFEILNHKGRDIRVLILWTCCIVRVNAMHGFCS